MELKKAFGPLGGSTEEDLLIIDKLNEIANNISLSTR
jgi:hypothetical protein